MSMRPFVSSLLVAALAAFAEPCAKPLYLTIDTGSMKPAAEIAAVLKKHNVKATFFLSNERTWNQGEALGAEYAPFWKALAADGHAFGSHTWRHWYFRQDLPGNRVAYVSPTGTREALSQAGVCAELRRVDDRFRAITGKPLSPLWRAPGGRTTPRTLAFAKACGYEHIGWDAAGFLGDELPSETYPNAKLLERALSRLKSGDVMVMHLGIRSRKDPFWPMLDPLLAGLEQKGFCFATLPAASGAERAKMK